MFIMLILKKTNIPDLSVWIYLFSPIKDNLSKTCRITAAETEHLIPSDAVSDIWGNFLKCFF